MTKSLKIIFPIAFIIITNLGSFCFQKLGQPFVFQIGADLLQTGELLQIGKTLQIGNTYIMTIHISNTTFATHLY